MATRTIQLRKVCPRCGERAHAEGKLPGFPGPRPSVYDLDDLPRLAARHSLGTLLALVELLPYKHFACPRCGYSFRLENTAAKEMVVNMLAALRPVTESRSRLVRRQRTRSAERPKTLTQMSRPPQRTVVASIANDWEPEGLD